MQILTYQTSAALDELVAPELAAITFIECRFQPDTIGFIQVECVKHLSTHVRMFAEYNPFPVYLHGYIATKSPELKFKEVKENLAEWLLRGNWYRPQPKLLKYIDDNVQRPKMNLPKDAAAPAEKDLIGVEELAKRLDLSIPTIRRWEQQGKIPSVRVGRTIRFYMPYVLETLLGVPKNKL